MRRLKILLTSAWLLSGLFCCVAADAAANFNNALKSSSFQLFSGDVNGDGRPDLLLKSVATIVPVVLDDDTDGLLVSVTVVPQIKSFILLSSSSGPYTLEPSPSNDLLLNPAWQAVVAALSFGSVQGNGFVSMFVPAVASGSPSFVVAVSATGNLQLLQQLSPDLIGFDLAAQGVEGHLLDDNTDGRADLIVTFNGRVGALLYADAQGILQRNDPASIEAVWRGMLSELGRANSDGAVAYLAADSKSSYGEMFAALGDGMKVVPPTLSNFRLVFVSPQAAEAVVTRIFNGQSTMQFVTFVATEHGWDIMEF